MHVLFYVYNHRTSTNLTVRPASATGTPENDNDDSVNTGIVAELNGVKTKNGGRRNGQGQDVKPNCREIEETPKPVHFSKKGKKLNSCKLK